jgi:AcrR family transcriptional regulator
VSSAHQAATRRSEIDGAGAAASRDAAPAPAGFSFPDAMRRDLEAGGKLPRSEATRRRLLIAAAELIQDAGFNGLKVADICKRAGFAHGTFYLHWPDRRAIAHDVLTEFMEAIKRLRPPRAPGQSFYQRLVHGHLYYIDVYRRNAGLMRCQGQLGDESEDFARIGLEANLGLARRVVRAVERELKEQALPDDGSADRLATALACIAMVDKLLHEIFVRGLQIGLSDAGLAAMFARTWHRSLLGCEPVAAHRD